MQTVTFYKKQWKEQNYYRIENNKKVTNWPHDHCQNFKSTILKQMYFCIIFIIYLLMNIWGVYFNIRYIPLIIISYFTCNEQVVYVRVFLPLPLSHTDNTQGVPQG